MNILEVSFLVSEIILFGAVVLSNATISRLKKQVDILQTKLDSFQDNIYHLQTYQRYDLKFELDEIKSQQEKSQVTISKLGMDLKSISEREVYPELLKILNLIELLNSKIDGETKNTKPTDSVKSQVVNIIKEEKTPTTTPIYDALKVEDNENSLESSIQLPVSRRKPKLDSKRVITSRELEQYFKEVTKLTYRGYVLKYGQEEFIAKKKKVYKKLYYQKFNK